MKYIKLKVFLSFNLHLQACFPFFILLLLLRLSLLSGATVATVTRDGDGGGGGGGPARTILSKNRHILACSLLDSLRNVDFNCN